MPRSPASHPGTDISEPRPGDPIPPRRSTRPRLQRSPCPGMMGTDETTKSPFPKIHNPFPHPPLIHAHPPPFSQLRGETRPQCWGPRCSSLLMGPLITGFCRHKRLVDKYYPSCGPGTEDPPTHTKLFFCGGHGHISLNTRSPGHQAHSLPNYTQSWKLDLTTTCLWSTPPHCPTL